MEDIQAELDATTARIEELRDRKNATRDRMARIETEMDELQAEQGKLQEEVAERAAELYRSGGADMVEALFGAEDFVDLTSRAEILSRVSQSDSAVFLDLQRSNERLETLSDELTRRQAELDDTEESLSEATDQLQAQFGAVSDEYEDLKAQIAAEAAAAAAAARAAARERREQAEPEPDPVAEPEPDPEPEPPSNPPTSGPAPPPPPVRTGGLTCPVAGPVSFVDSWGAPRDGHTHQGVDMMADYGTPVVAITSGNITYAAYSAGGGGNMIFLTGDNGNAYWYLHNQRNLVTSGHVSTGQQIATVGDTGNATGIPHLHFEYHPGGGGPINPYPLVASIC